MLERSEYPPGVPCWIDTAQPDPEAATKFYGGLFGSEFEDQMPSDAPGNYFIARLHGLDVAAIGSSRTARHRRAYSRRDPERPSGRGVHGEPV